MRKIIGRLILSVALLVVMLVGMVVLLLRASLPTSNATVTLKGLSASAHVDFDKFGIPAIYAKTREDAFQVLGFVTAQDRLFQMDLLRRKMSGRLAEIMGAGPFKSDRWSRIMGFNQLAHDIYAILPDDQKKVLIAYTEGVNQAIANYKVLPFEFLLLRYSPEPWRVEDSLLAVLSMQTTLSWRANKDRNITVMRATLPAKVADFLLPSTDIYTDYLLKRNSAELKNPLPLADLIEVLQRNDTTQTLSQLTGFSMLKEGSNAWLVAPAKTANNRAIIANDMHMALGVPNIWYRAELHYDNVHVAGISLPGLPLIISGSNRHIAWGFTSSGADTSDLVMIDVDPTDSSKYLTQQGSRRFIERTETINIRGGKVESLTVKTTEWGPLLAEPLLNKPVAARWTVLDPQATNLDFLDLDQTASVTQALPLMNKAGAPVLQALVADAEGNIGWTLTGRIPIRFGMKGLQSFSWATGQYGWKGYIAAEALPRSINPASGFVVSANQSMVGSDYPYSSISNYDWRGNRAYQINQRLQQMSTITEKDMLVLQMDSYGEIFQYYQKLALDALDDKALSAQPELAEIKRYLQAWNGHAELNAKGFGLLVEFRRMLQDEVLSPFLAPCRAVDAQFVYDWPYFDVPLQQLLDSKNPELLPNKDRYHTWDIFTRDILARGAKNLLSRYQVNSLDELTWGRINNTKIAHPLALAIPLLGPLLNMPEHPLSGCGDCMGNTGATERLVVAPGYDEEGLLVIPTGESGNPLSPHYGDQNLQWVQGIGIPLWSTTPFNRLDFEPTAH